MTSLNFYHGESIASSMAEVWVAQNFPSTPPSDSGVSEEAYREFVDAFIGQPIEPCWLEADCLERSQALGLSWKTYLMRVSLDNWD